MSYSKQQMGFGLKNDDLFSRPPSQNSPLPAEWNEEMDHFAIYHVYYPMWSPVGRSFQHVYKNLNAQFPSLEWGGGFYPEFERKVKSLVQAKEGGAPILQTIQQKNYSWVTENKPLPPSWTEEYDHYIIYHRYLVAGAQHMTPNYVYEMLTTAFDLGSGFYNAFDSRLNKLATETQYGKTVADTIMKNQYWWVWDHETDPFGKGGIEGMTWRDGKKRESVTWAKDVKKG